MSFELVLHSLNFFASDILLSVFFFAIGLDLIDEFKNGELKNAKQASLPAFAAVGGVVVPALLYLLIINLLGLGSAYSEGWAIPTATDVAFSLAVLTIFRKWIKNKGVKLFLLVLAVVDDVIGIVIIAFVFTKGVNIVSLLATLVVVSFWVVLVRKQKLNWFILAILAVLVWLGVYFSGIHPTIAGVILGITVPAKKFNIKEDDFEKVPPDAKNSRAKYWSSKLTPITNNFVVPVFAICSLIISGYELVNGFSNQTAHVGFNEVYALVLAITIALLIGKPFGIILFAYVGKHLTPLELFHKLRVRDLFGAAALGGIGFTVSFLIAELSFLDPFIVAIARIGVLAGSCLSAIFGSLLIVLQNKKSN